MRLPDRLTGEDAVPELVSLQFALGNALPRIPAERDRAVAQQACHHGMAIGFAIECRGEATARLDDHGGQQYSGVPIERFPEFVPPRVIFVRQGSTMRKGRVLIKGLRSLSLLALRRRNKPFEVLLRVAVGGVEPNVLKPLPGGVFPTCLTGPILPFRI